ncbi:hypothetical protein [Tranquillimonas alkanivorans]|uniref:Uncharacterized protein n=1 Tax=Tranquillimonas alkanivorans TaxID=441119 RepID=A0A1I5QNI3_9RHOB|nr:hypothetical protein [Tranquillimonas alkanivorans]SFP47660.1 hypothetical protein SAMN04488047_10730 [Tranquillimonas alkanivorans]
MPITTSRLAPLCALILAAAPGPLAAQDQAGQDAPAPSSDTVVVFEFTATDVQAEGDLTARILGMAEAPQVARVVTSGPPSDGATRVEGALVFDGLDAFSTWRESEMEPFFQPVGGTSGLDTTLRIFRADLVAAGNPDGAGGALGDVSVTYHNSDNDSAGDADIDAVTVVCPGDHADCKPSN